MRILNCIQTNIQKVNLEKVSTLSLFPCISFFLIFEQLASYPRFTTITIPCMDVMVHMQNSGYLMDQMYIREMYVFNTFTIFKNE
jgi:hypothetical protein